MPYEGVEDLPDQVRKVLPEHARHIYLKAYTNAWAQYEDPGERRGPESREEVSHKVAWAAVKQEYEKNEQTGKWERKPDK